uniref:Uncharacterized protein n=1 Tax=Timema tahoe TaxID=61484 RepID=A0A7R9FMT9_9NEOP|nr:unnamed protein product [Timema tahoe]
MLLTSSPVWSLIILHILGCDDTSSAQLMIQTRDSFQTMARFVCVDEYEEYALQHLDKNALDYYKSGAGDEITLGQNKTAFKRYGYFVCIAAL